MATTDWNKLGQQLEGMGYKQNPAQPPVPIAPPSPPAPQGGGIISSANAQPAAAAQTPASGPVPQSRQIANQMLMGPPSTMKEMAQQQRLWGQAKNAEINERYDAVGPQMAQEARDAAFMSLSRANGPASFVAPAPPAASQAETKLASYDAANPPISAPPPPPATSAPAAAPASSPDIPDRWAQVRGYGATPSPAPAAAQPQNQVMPGVYSHGRGQYSDSPDGMGFKPGFTGQPNAQNLAAADGLAARALSQPPTPTPTTGGMGLAQAAGASLPEAGFSGVIGSPINNGLMGSRTPEQQRRDAEVSASSIMNNGGRWDQHKGMSPARQALMAMDAQALEGIRGQNSMAQEAMHQAGGLQREGLQQAGANQRSIAQAALEQQKINQAGVTQGYANRASSLAEAARNQIAAEQDPTKRRSLVQYMNDIEGKTTQADPYLVVPGGQHVDANSGKAYNTPSTVFNRNTGQFVQQPGQGGDLSSNPQALAIRNDPNLTREQKIAALQKAGF